MFWFSVHKLQQKAVGHESSHVEKSHPLGGWEICWEKIAAAEV